MEPLFGGPLFKFNPRLTLLTGPAGRGGHTLFVLLLFEATSFAVTVDLELTEGVRPPAFSSAVVEAAATTVAVFLEVGRGAAGVELVPAAAAAAAALWRLLGTLPSEQLLSVSTFWVAAAERAAVVLLWEPLPPLSSTRIWVWRQFDLCRFLVGFFVF